MDVALMSMAQSQGQVQQQASISIMKKAMGNAEQQSEALQKLMSTSGTEAVQQATHPHLGGSVDLKV